MPESITATPTPLPVRPWPLAPAAPTLWVKVVCRPLPLPSPVVLTFVFSVTFRTPLAPFSARASFAESLTAKPPIAGSESVTVPWCARTIARARRSETPGLNWASATTVRWGAWAAAALSFIAALGVAWATEPPRANGIASATSAAAVLYADKCQAPPCATSIGLAFPGSANPFHHSGELDACLRRTTCAAGFAGACPFRLGDRFADLLLEQIQRQFTDERPDARPVLVRDVALQPADPHGGLARVLGAHEVGGGRRLVG